MHALASLTSLASLPSPSGGAIELGPLTLRAYGLFIALGVIAAVTLASRRWEARGGDPGDISAIAIWAVPAGLVGARLYHVITDWQLFEDDPADIVKVWEGGLGIWGAIAGGAIVGVLVARKRGMDIPTLLDACAPALPLAQAIGRWGNWFNQELFGRPTDLPWALEIDPEHRPARYAAEETFHPTFLYESLWCLLIAGVLIAAGRRWRDRLAPGNLFVAYVGLYTLGRFFFERLRVDPANEIAGLRINEWVSLVLFVGAWTIFAVRQARHRRRRQDPRGPDTDADASIVVEEG